MSRLSSALLSAALVSAAIVLAAAPAGAQTLTRIETKPFYGAVVTIEGGVRVFRPLPPTGHIIINPGGRTPVNLSINEYRDYSSHAGGVVAVPGGYDTGDGGTRGLYLNPWSRWGRHGHHRHFGHHGKVGRYVTHIGGGRHAVRLGGGKHGGGKGGGHH